MATSRLEQRRLELIMQAIEDFDILKEEEDPEGIDTLSNIFGTKPKFKNTKDLKEFIDSLKTKDLAFGSHNHQEVLAALDQMTKENGLIKQYEKLKGIEPEVKADIQGLTPLAQERIKLIMQVIKNYKILEGQSNRISALSKLFGTPPEFTNIKELTGFIDGLKNKNLAVGSYSHEEVQAALNQMTQESGLINQYDKALYEKPANITDELNKKPGDLRPPEVDKISTKTTAIGHGYTAIKDSIRDVYTAVTEQIDKDDKVYEKRRDLGLSLLKLVVGVANAGILVEIVHKAALASAEIVKATTEAGKSGSEAAAGAASEAQESLTTAIYAALAAELVKEIGEEFIPLYKETEHFMHASHAEHGVHHAAEHGEAHAEKEQKGKKLTTGEVEVAAKRALKRVAINISHHYQNIDSSALAEIVKSFNDITTLTFAKHDKLIDHAIKPATKNEVEQHFNQAAQQARAELEDEKATTPISPGEAQAKIKLNLAQQIRSARGAALEKSLRFSPAETVAYGIGFAPEDDKRAKSNKKELENEVNCTITRTLVAAFLMRDYNSPESVKLGYQTWSADINKDLFQQHPGFVPLAKGGDHSKPKFFPTRIAEDHTLLRALDAQPPTNKNTIGKGIMHIGGQHLRRHVYSTLPEFKDTPEYGYSANGEFKDRAEKHRMRDAWRSEFIVSHILGDPPFPSMKTPKELVDSIKTIILANTFFHPRSHMSDTDKRTTPSPLHLLTHLPEFEKLFKNMSHKNLDALDDQIDELAENIELLERTKPGDRSEPENLKLTKMKEQLKVLKDEFSRYEDVQGLLTTELSNTFIMNALTDPNIHGPHDKPRMMQTLDTLFEFLKATNSFPEMRLNALKEQAKTYVNHQCDNPISKLNKDIEQLQDLIKRQQVDQEMKGYNRLEALQQVQKAAETAGDKPKAAAAKQAIAELTKSSDYNVYDKTSIEKLQAEAKLTGNKVLQEATNGLLAKISEKDKLLEERAQFFPSPAKSKVAKPLATPDKTAAESATPTEAASVSTTASLNKVLGADPKLKLEQEQKQKQAAIAAAQQAEQQQAAHAVASKTPDSATHVGPTVTVRRIS